MGNLSSHFSREEFACDCGCGFDTVDIELVSCLEGMCSFFKKDLKASRIIVVILSGCRCREHNEFVQKRYNPDYIEYSSNSVHMYGGAVDFYMLEVKTDLTRKVISPGNIVRYLIASYPGKHGIGEYTNRVHFDIKTGRARRW